MMTLVCIFHIGFFLQSCTHTHTHTHLHPRLTTLAKLQAPTWKHKHAMHNQMSLPTFRYRADTNWNSFNSWINGTWIDQNTQENTEPLWGTTGKPNL